jgi:outer membrane protein assembly factor BamB
MGEHMKNLIVSVALGCFAGIASGAEPQLAWPRFRGPNGSGVADDQAPPVKIGPETNVKWSVPVPEGLSSPIVAGDNLVLTAFDGGKLYTIAYRRADGKEAWRSEAPAKKIEAYLKDEGSPAASTPATDGQRIVSYFGSCGLLCYDMAGKQLWKFEMPTATTWGNFGSGTSPILVDNLVILVRDEMKGSRILALDAVTGSLKWEKARQSIVGYCTPIVWETPVGKQLVVAGVGRMIGYDLKTGEEKWFQPGMPAGPCASPVVADGTLYFAGGSPTGPDDKEMQMPSFDDLLKQADTNKDGALSKEEAQNTMLKDSFEMLDFNKDGKITRDEWGVLIKLISEGRNSAFALSPGGWAGDVSGRLLWKKTKGLPYIPCAIVYRGQLVMIKDGGLVSAYDARTGKEVYLQERVAAPGPYYSSPVAANGHIYFTSLTDGTVTVLKAGASKAEVVVKNPKFGERVSATPAIAGDTLYLRTASKLYAFAEKK